MGQPAEGREISLLKKITTQNILMRGKSRLIGETGKTQWTSAVSILEMGGMPCAVDCC